MALPLKRDAEDLESTTYVGRGRHSPFEQLERVSDGGWPVRITPQKVAHTADADTFAVPALADDGRAAERVMAVRCGTVGSTGRSASRKTFFSVGREDVRPPHVVIHALAPQSNQGSHPK